MRRLLLLALAVSLGSIAAAQTVAEQAREYVPLHVGDTWVYAYASEECSGFSTPGGCVRTDTTLTYRVVGVQVEGTDTVAVVEGPNGAPGLYGLRADGLEFAHGSTGQYVGRYPAAPESPESGFASALSRAPLLWSADVGGRAYDLEAAVVAPPLTHVYARGVGLVEYRREKTRGSGGRSSTTSWRLQAATVADRNDGAFATAAGPDLEAGPATVTAFPNPTASRTTLRVQAESPGVLEVAVLDVLGREVWSTARATAGGASDLEVDLGDAPAGVYLVRSALDGVPLPTVTVTRR